MTSISEKTKALKKQNAGKGLAVLTASLAASPSPSQSPLEAAGWRLRGTRGESRRAEKERDVPTKCIMKDKERENTKRIK